MAPVPAILLDLGLLWDQVRLTKGAVGAVSFHPPPSSSAGHPHGLLAERPSHPRP